MKSKLVFDTTDTDTILDSDSVGAYLRASDGTLLTHTDVSGKKALDVRVAEGINVEVDLDFADDSVTAHQGGTWTIASITNAVTVQATDLDIRDLAFATDSVDVSGSAVSITGTVAVTQSTSPWVVSATDLDIRDLAFATDSVTAHQGGTWAIDSITNAVTVTATNLDIRDLTAVSDSVQSWLHDGAGTALTSTLVGADQALDVNVVNSISVNDVALANAAVAAASKTTVGDVVASPLANRKYLYVLNNGNRAAYIGPNGVTVANGFPVNPGSMVELRAGAAIDLEFAQSGGSIDLRSLELA